MLKNVSQAMSANPLTVQPDASLDTVIRLLTQRHISALPVVDRDRQLVGLISRTDLLWQESGVTPPLQFMLFDSLIYLETPGRYHRELHKALGQTVADVMTRSVQLAHPEEALSIAARRMQEHHIHQLPVVDRCTSALVGILTQGDILRAMAADLVAAGQPIDAA
jgi:CBS domain-containing protein